MKILAAPDYATAPPIFNVRATHPAIHYKAPLAGSMATGLLNSLGFI